MEKLKTVLLSLLTLGVLSIAGITAAGFFKPIPPAQWEYMSLPVTADTAFSDMGDRDLNPNKPQLDALGKQGWELVGVSTEMETTHPNFGSSQYVTGLQPNVRADRAVLLFKRVWKPAPQQKAMGVQGQP